MSYHDGWAALNLDMPDRVPRTEYSVSEHWEVVSRVTGIDVRVTSPDDVKRRARQAFQRAWNFDLNWSTLIGSGEFGDIRTSMGHAEYAAGAVDWNTNIFCPFETPEQVLAFDPWEAFGQKDQLELKKRFELSYRENCRANPDSVNMTGIYVTLISGLIDLFGWEMLLLAAGIDPRAFGELANRYASWIQQYYDALATADVPVIMSHDDIVWTAGPFISPAWYRQYVFPNYKRFYEPLLASGKKILYTSDGNYTEFVDDLAQSGVHGFVLEPLTDMALIAEKYGGTHVFIGNADTRILLYGSKAQICAEVERCMKIGKSCPGFFMAVGNHIPANTPVESVLYYNEVYEERCRR
ncbi:hypothetical protein JXJ21_00380 [candidate division KSB1 bacterium]|nr:hypothetical protein [candidate division KSB1 bacterium]